MKLKRDEVRAIASEALESAATAMAFCPHDFASHHRTAWVYGILLGWNKLAMNELRATFKWDDATVARLQRYRKAVKAMQSESERRVRGEGKGRPPQG